MPKYVVNAIEYRDALAYVLANNPAAAEPNPNKALGTARAILDGLIAYATLDTRPVKGNWVSSSYGLYVIATVDSDILRIAVCPSFGNGYDYVDAIEMASADLDAWPQPEHGASGPAQPQQGAAGAGSGLCVRCAYPVALDGLTGELCAKCATAAQPAPTRPVSAPDAICGPSGLLC